jgi:olfactory receptor
MVHHFWDSFFNLLFIMHLNFSVVTEIPHFFCELPSLLKAASFDAHINNIVLYATTALLGVFLVPGIFLSYSQIISSLMRMSSTAIKYKAFSTCGSHLCMVSLFHGIRIEEYHSFTMIQSFQGSMIASVMYTMITPMLNPFIYSLRSKDMKGALGRLLSRVASCL